MKYLLLLALVLSTPALADQAENLCATNPAYSPRVMLGIVQAQLEGDHDPSLDSESPEKLANQASAQGITECAAQVRSDPSIASALAGLKGADLQVAWDAYNTACSDRKGARGACMVAELQSARALKHMVATDQPAGVKTLVQACELMMTSDPAMAEWRQCVDEGLAVHAPAKAAARCKVSVTWHAAKTGAEAGRMLAACLKG
jgi:hypothetical protein